MFKTNEYTDNFKSNLTCIFFSIRAKLKKNTLPSDTVYRLTTFICEKKRERIVFMKYHSLTLISLINVEVGIKVEGVQKMQNH